MFAQHSHAAVVYNNYSFPDLLDEPDARELAVWAVLGTERTLLPQERPAAGKQCGLGKLCGTQQPPPTGRT